MFVNGDEHQGQFEFGQRHGRGQLREKESGDEFTGTWIQDKLEGLVYLRSASEGTSR